MHIHRNQRARRPTQPFAEPVNIGRLHDRNVYLPSKLIDPTMKKRFRIAMQLAHGQRFDFRKGRYIGPDFRVGDAEICWGVPVTHKTCAREMDKVAWC
jgi:hypothetical protein